MSKTLGIRDIYKHYRTENKKGSLMPEFLEILKQYNQFLSNKLLEGECVQLPERLGTLEFTGVKTKPRIDDQGRIQGLSPDWKKTLDLWNKCEECKNKKEIIFFFNEATQGIRYSIKWSKKKVFVSNKDYYSFRLSFTNRKAFKDAIVDGKEYLVVTQKKRS